LPRISAHSGTENAVGTRIWSFFSGYEETKNAIGKNHLPEHRKNSGRVWAAVAPDLFFAAPLIAATTKDFRCGLLFSGFLRAITFFTKQIRTTHFVQGIFW